MEIMDDIARCNIFMDSVSLGVQYRPDDISFTDFLLFKWIKEQRSK